MKILFYYLQDLDLNTGTPLRAKNTIKFLSEKQEAVVVAENLSSEDILSKVKFHKINQHFHLKGLNFFFKVRDLKRIVKKEKPDILYGFTCNSIFALSSISKDLKIPLVIEMHEPGHANFDPNIVWRYILGSLEKKALKHVNGIVTVSSKIRDYYLDLAKNPNLHSKVIYGGVDTNLFSPNVKPAPEIEKLKQQGKMIIGYIGNFKAYQGIDFILESALATKQDFLYAMVGKDSKELKEKIAKYNLQDKIFVFGRKKYEDIPSYLKGMDILVIPRASNYITEYAFPSKLSEYLAMGKVVVTTDAGGAGEIIKDKENGILIPSSNIPQNLTESFNLIKSNKELKEKIETTALDFVNNNLTWEKQISELNNFLENIVNKP